MEKLILIITILATFSFAVSGSEKNEELDKTQQGYQSTLLTTCQDYAVQDDVERVMLDDYLLDCMNSELKRLGYEEVTDLPEAEELPVTKE